MSIGAEQRYYLKLKAVHYYYEKDYTQTEIAQMLNISRITLGKLLREAREEGMVKIEIVDQRNLGQLLELEVKLKDAFGLLDVKIVDCQENDPEEIARRIAGAAARYVEHLLRSNMKLGMAWGRTLELMVEQMSENRNITNLELVTLLGGAGTADSRIQPNILAQRVLEKFSGRGYIINAPYICQSPELCSAIKNEPHIAEVLERSCQTDLTLVGIGEKPTPTSSREGGYNFENDTLQQLVQAGAVGDICANFYDIHGKPCNTELRQRTIAIDLADLPKHKKVLALGGGPNKWESVLGALRGGYLNIIITDKFTAASVLQHS